jgi:hypothetical protein
MAAPAGFVRLATVCLRRSIGPSQLLDPRASVVRAVFEWTALRLHGVMTRGKAAKRRAGAAVAITRPTMIENYH